MFRLAFIRKAALSAYSRNHAGEVKETFNEPDSMCAAVRAAADKWTEIIREASQSNPNLVRAQWEILHLAGDFHPGWKAALIQVEDMYYDEMVNKRAKRSDRKVTTEVNGARDRALRKIKSDLDHAPQTGESFTPGNARGVIRARDLGRMEP